MFCYTKDAYNYFVENRQEYFNHSFDENDPLLLTLKEDIAFNFNELYQQYCLEERIRISYEEMSSITPNYSCYNHKALLQSHQGIPLPPSQKTNGKWNT